MKLIPMPVMAHQCKENILKTVDTIKKMEQDLFAFIEAHHEMQLERKLEGFYQESNLKAKLDRFEEVEQFLSPEEMEQVLDEIKGSIELMEDVKEKKELQNRMEHVHFQQIFPILAELNPQIHGFAHELTRITQVIESSNRIDILQELNQDQLEEIVKISRRSA